MPQIFLIATELESLNVFGDVLCLVDIACREIVYRTWCGLRLDRAGTGNSNQIGNDLRIFALRRYRVAERREYQEYENQICNARRTIVTAFLMIEQYDAP